MNKSAKYWLDLSEYDFETAQAMLQSKRFLYVGFMCHQSIEKSLKPFLLIPKVKMLLSHIVYPTLPKNVISMNNYPNHKKNS